MDIDSGGVPTSNENDLSQYNLDDYDDDVQTTSKSCSHCYSLCNQHFVSSHGSIHQYQRSNILQRQRRRPLHHTKRCMTFSLNSIFYIYPTPFSR